ncbi:MAG: hypothetical protein ACI9UR_000640 [Bacteroidia bacterium]
MKISQFLLLLLINFSAFGQNIDSLLSTPYVNSGLAVLDTQAFNFTTSYSTSGSYWAVDSFPESVVFHAEISQTSELDTSHSFQLRVGKGGHLYSFRGEFGESVPPQWRPSNWVQPTYGGGTSYAPWVDEVWQLVCVDGELNTPPDSSYFIHQSGVYLKTPEQTEPFYSPILAEYFNEADQSYAVVNWGQQAHTEDLASSGYTSNLLYYTKYKSIGQGIVQVDNLIYNFGSDNINFLNAPWGGVRNSNLEHFFISTPTNDYNNSPGQYGQTPVLQTASSGGWVAWSDDTNGNSNALGMAHPTTTNTNNSVFRYGDAGNLSTNQRDYNVFEMIRFPAPGQLGFGRSLGFRYFYVLGASVDDVKSTIIDHQLVSSAFDTAFIPNREDVDSVAYWFHELVGAIETSVDPTFNGLKIRTQPYLNSYPLFKLTSASGIQRISSDPYLFSDIAYDGETVAMELLGFLDEPADVYLQYDTICAGENQLFPDGVELTDIDSSLNYLSQLPAAQLAWDSVIVSHLFIHQVDTEVTQNSMALASNATESEFQWLDCEQNFSEITGEVDSNFTAIDNGIYAVTIEQNGCVDTSACYAINRVGIVTFEQSMNMIVYPNPSDGTVFIDLSQGWQGGSINLYSINGSLNQSVSITGPKLKLSLPTTSGTYTIKAVAEDGSTLVKTVFRN